MIYFYSNILKHKRYLKIIKAIKYYFFQFKTNIVSTKLVIFLLSLFVGNIEERHSKSQQTHQLPKRFSPLG